MYALNKDINVITHSEHIINWIGEMIYLKKEKHSDFQIIILYDDGTRRSCFYNAEGYIENWDYGFFRYLDN
jgi:hypothetical protein